MCGRRKKKNQEPRYKIQINKKKKKKGKKRRQINRSKEEII